MISQGEFIERTARLMGFRLIPSPISIDSIDIINPQGELVARGGPNLNLRHICIVTYLRDKKGIDILAEFWRSENRKEL